jgi:hypothetical protein
MSRPVRRAACLAFVLAGTTVATAAAADPPADEPKAEPKSDEPAWERAQDVRRSGFTVGLSVGIGLGMAAGYPNDVKKIGRERYYAEVPMGPGGALTLWLGGALTDWLVFAAGLTGSGLSSDDKTAGFTAFTFRTEAFPLFGLGGIYRELGVGIEAGTGGGTITPTDDPETILADSSAASRLGIGVFYDGLRAWRFSMGPFLSTDYAWSETMRRGEVVAGWRTVLYAGP